MNEETFLQAICNKHEADDYRVFADWLEDQGDPRAEYARVRGEMVGLCGDDPRYHDILQRLQGKPKGLAETNPRYRQLLLREKELRRQFADALAPWQRRFSLERIKRLLRLKRADFDRDDLDDEAGDGRIWPFQPNRRLTEKRLLAWEKEHAIGLPEAYRLFLCEVGNGGDMPGGWVYNLRIYPLEEVEVKENVHSPFPLTSEHARLLADRKFDRAKCTDPVLRAFLADFDESPPGALTVGMPNADYQAPALLIVAGEQCGKMWAARGGWLPECGIDSEQLDFLGWFEHLLDLDTY